MHFRLSLTLLSVLTAFTPARADEPNDGEIVTVDATAIFAPVGFDDNDEAEVVVDGYLPSGCYRLAQPEITVDKTARTVTVTPKARYFDVPCIEAMIPYFFVAPLGQLDDGDYAVKVTGASRTLVEQLPVKHAVGPGPDDYPYAPVDDVKVSKDSTTGKLTATLRGRLTSSCMHWSEARIQDNGKTVNILPILTIDSEDDGRDCDAVETPYERTVDIPASVSTGRHLLHVRSLNGQAVNQLFFK